MYYYYYRNYYYCYYYYLELLLLLLLLLYNPSRSLRSSTLNYLSVPKSNTATYGDRCFSVAAPKLWNSLPGDFRYIENLCTFKTSIKTWLFKSAFNLT